MPAARRRRVRRRLRRYRNVWNEYNVLRTKCEYSTPLLFPGEAGQPYFHNTTNNNRSWITFPQMMEAYGKNTMLREMFGYCKITGIKVEVIPHSNNMSVAGLSNQTPVCLAFLMGVSAENANAAYADLIMVNTSMIVDPTNRQSRYYSLKGAAWDLKGANDNNLIAAGTMIVRAMNAGAFNVSPGWNIKITLYCYWRYAKVL